MKIGIFNRYECFNSNNGIFDPARYTIVAGGEKPMIALRDMLAQKGHELCTLDRYSVEEFDKFIFLDYPDKHSSLLEKLESSGKDMFLVLLESEIVYRENFIEDNHRCFKKVFTWSDLINKADKYVKLMIAQNLEPQSNKLQFVDRKLACMVAGNKTSRDKRELYSERRNIIRYSEKNYPQDFDLYGKEWDKGGYPNENPLLKKIYKSLKIKKPFPSYKGEVVDKRNTLSQYRFNFCLENVQGINGYITEKLFDAILSGCVPIYWGAPDIFSYVPKDCLVYYPDFKNISELYKYIKKMEEQEWQNYIQKAKEFIESEKIKKFSPECFATTIVNNIL